MGLYFPSLLSENLKSVSQTQNGCFKSSAAMGRASASLVVSFDEMRWGYIVKHLSKKSFASGDMCSRTSSGIGGAFLSLPSLNMAPIASSVDHGRLPANISKTTHPNDHISILALYPSFRL